MFEKTNENAYKRPWSGMAAARMEETNTVIWTIGVRDEVGGVSSLFLSAPGILPGGGGQEVLIAVETVVVGREESVNSDQTALITHCYALKASRPARLSLSLCVEGVEMQMKFSHTKLFLFRLSASCDLRVIHVSTRNRIDQKLSLILRFLRGDCFLFNLTSS